MGWFVNYRVWVISGLLLVVPVLVWIIATKFIAAEEQAMDATFGEAYQAYKQRVRRWI